MRTPGVILDPVSGAEVRGSAVHNVLVEAMLDHVGVRDGGKRNMVGARIRLSIVAQATSGNC